MNDASQATPSLEQKKLGVFIGRWRTTGEVAATGSTPASAVESIDTYQWYPGGFFLIHHADAQIGGESLKSLEIIGYSSDRECYFASFFDSNGDHGAEDIRLDGDTWTWRGSNVMSVKEHRCVAVVSEDGDTIRARHEKSDDGQNWTLWMDVTLAKET